MYLFYFSFFGDIPPGAFFPLQSGLITLQASWGFPLSSSSSPGNSLYLSSLLGPSFLIPFLRNHVQYVQFLCEVVRVKITLFKNISSKRFADMKFWVAKACSLWLLKALLHFILVGVQCCFSEIWSYSQPASSHFDLCFFPGSLWDITFASGVLTNTILWLSCETFTITFAGHLAESSNLKTYILSHIWEIF